MLFQQVQADLGGLTAVTVKLHATGQNRISALPANDRGRVFPWLIDFAQNQRGFGNQLEKIITAPGLWTARVTQNYRGPASVLRRSWGTSLASEPRLGKGPWQTAQFIHRLGPVGCCGSTRRRRVVTTCAQSLTEPLQVEMDNGARRVLVPIENKRQFLEVDADVLSTWIPCSMAIPCRRR